ncbi:hypothetical protein HELRODRAFT_173638 [Helobdella robusta]|uniref:Uncharacterized protein n=1 Tax=Helobdella robusta TaxID=6412 RepID=T1F729_HELRO|nr:hypothetical protein HELRODRAFT_173638 [Helobdella robusta]ESO03348.1 hypothetical protein HELRODRAFT_173638 [Helobdella robusta]
MELEMNAVHFAQRCNLDPGLAPFFQSFNTSQISINIFEKPDYLHSSGDIVNYWLLNSTESSSKMLDVDNWLIGCGKSYCTHFKSSRKFYAYGDSLTVCYYYNGSLLLPLTNGYNLTECDGNATNLCGVTCVLINTDCSELESETCICRMFFWNNNNNNNNVDDAPLNKSILPEPKIIVHPYSHGVILTPKTEMAYEDETASPAAASTTKTIDPTTELHNFQIPCCTGCGAGKYEDPCLRFNLDCRELRNTPFTYGQPPCSGHLKTETETKNLPTHSALPIPHYMGHRPLFPHPLPPDPRDFIGCHTTVNDRTACCPGQNEPIRHNSGCY